MSRRSLSALVLCLLAVSGCSSSKGYPVSGKVLVNGQPAAGAIVVLTPVANPGSMDKKPSGMTKDDGTFVLNTLTDSDGVVPGDYLVTITWPGKPKSSAPPKGLAGGDDGGPRPPTSCAASTATRKRPDSRSRSRRRVIRCNRSI